MTNPDIPDDQGALYEAAGKAAAEAYRHWRNTTEVQNLSILTAQIATAVADAVAPLAADQARAKAVTAVNGRANDLRSDFRSGSYGIEYINGMEDAVGVVERSKYS